MPTPPYFEEVLALISTPVKSIVPPSLYTPPPSSDVLPETFPFFITTLPAYITMPPPSFSARFSLISVFSMVSVLFTASTRMPPPSSVLDMLPVTREFLMIASLPRWTMSPPPSFSEVFPEISTLSISNVPLSVQ